jgi:hypothetical protein
MVECISSLCANTKPLHGLWRIATMVRAIWNVGNTRLSASHFPCLVTATVLQKF